MQHVQRNKDSAYKLNITPRWSPDGTSIITRWNKSAQVSLITDEGISQGANLDHKDDVWDFSFSSDGSKLLVGYGRQNATLWDFHNKTKIKDIKCCTRSIRNEALIHNTWSPTGDFYAIRWE
jgi:WD40 repeat protein